MFIQYSQRFWRPIQDLSDKYNILQAAMAACERIFKLLDTKPEIVSPAHPIAGDGIKPYRVSPRVVHVSETDAEQKDLVEARRHRPTALCTCAQLTDIEWILKDVAFVVEPDRPLPSSATPERARPRSPA